MSKFHSVFDFLSKSAGTTPTRALQIRLEDKYIDDGSINEWKDEKVRSGETPRRAIQKRYKSNENV